MKTGTKLGLAGLALAIGAVALWFYLVRQVNLPEDRTGFVLVFLSAAGLGVAAYVKGTSIPGAIPAALAILIGLFLPFTIYISAQAPEADKLIKIGDSIPYFTALDDQEKTFDSNSLNDHLVLIKFFRAHW